MIANSSISNPLFSSPTDDSVLSGAVFDLPLVSSNISLSPLDYSLLATPSLPNDSGFSHLWGLNNTGQTGGTIDADIDAPEAWAVQPGKPIVVAVIDSGVEYTHPDLVQNLWTNPGEIAGNGMDDDGNGYVDDYYGYDFGSNDSDPMDEQGHGTHVAGIIAADGDNGIGITGVNPNARVMSLKFMGSGGTGTINSVVRAIEYAVAMGAKIINASWGGSGFSQALLTTIRTAQQAGILFVAAAGNEAVNNDVTPTYPANFDLDNLISVAATDHTDQLASFSNYGATSVDLGAPGSRIVSTYLGGKYAFSSGTSMATPHVSGVASLIWSQNPNLSVQQVRDLILSSVDPVPALQGKTLSGGRLNASNALKATPIPTEPKNTLEPFVVESSGNTTLVHTAKGYELQPKGRVAIALRYEGVQVTNTSFWNIWSAIGAEAVADGYEAVWANNLGQFYVWKVDAAGNFLHTINTQPLMANDLLSRETLFQQDFNGDGRIEPSIPPTTIEAVGNTTLVHTETGYQLQPKTGSSIALRYEGVQVTNTTFWNVWSAIGAEAVADGYEAIWTNNAGQFYVWQVDAAGNFLKTLNTEPLSANHLLSRESVFQQDFDGDGQIAPSTLTVESVGNTKLLHTPTGYQLQPNAGAAVPLTYDGVNVTDMTFTGLWFAIGAEAVAGGYEAVWVNNIGQFYVWKIDAAGNFLNTLNRDPLTASDYDLLSREPLFQQDFNGDQQVGPMGVTSSTLLLDLSSTPIGLSTSGLNPSIA
ncbi:MAG: S8 family serine peptidase [Leptolyngbyaceae cyanobacterium bins.59]|nr:S8 family serine peptidase [Leptolyngbyaceae cyanobacterium bins.59]